MASAFGGQRSIQLSYGRACSTAAKQPVGSHRPIRRGRELPLDGDALDPEMFGERASISRNGLTTKIWVVPKTRFDGDRTEGLAKPPIAPAQRRQTVDDRPVLRHGTACGNTRMRTRRTPISTHPPLAAQLNL